MERVNDATPPDGIENSKRQKKQEKRDQRGQAGSSFLRTEEAGSKTFVWPRYEWMDQMAKDERCARRDHPALPIRPPVQMWWSWWLIVQGVLVVVMQPSMRCPSARLCQSLIRLVLLVVVVSFFFHSFLSLFSPL